MPAKFTGTAEQTLAYSASVLAEAGKLRISINDNRQIIAATRAMVLETQAAIALLDDWAAG
jgi:hypothetical protein